jgi:hypothetical protein
MSNKVISTDIHIHIQLGSLLPSAQTATEPSSLCHYKTHRLSLPRTCSRSITCFHYMAINMQYLSYTLWSLIMNKLAVDVHCSVLPVIGYRTQTCSRNLSIFMYLLWILYSLLSRQTNAQHTHTHTYIYIPTIFYIISFFPHDSIYLHHLQAVLYFYFATTLAQQKYKTM